MFSFFGGKSKETNNESIVSELTKLDWLDQYLTIHNDLPRPDWNAIYRHADENFSGLDQNQLWADIAKSWVSSVVDHLPHDYICLESANFLLFSDGETKRNKAMATFLERTLKRLLLISKGITCDAGFGKYVVIVTADIDSYYDYISYYYGEEGGVFGLSTGMYINNGYGHFVFVQDELDVVEPIIAHEMTHALLSHLPIPNWLNEGMAVNMESMITGHAPLRLNQSLVDKHHEFWGQSEIQEFWQGKSFFRPDDGQMLSYQLAQMLVTNLSEGYDEFVLFANKANFSDGGEAAMQEIYDLSLGDIIANFLGEGEWRPEPTIW